MIIKPCPICGKQPKVTEKNDVMTIQCKPLFEKPHLIVQNYSYYRFNNLNEVITEWNKQVEAHKGESYGTERKDR